MNPATVQKWSLLLLRIAFGLLLIAASIDKIVHPYAFARALENYQVLGAGLSRWIAVWLPYVELSTGLLLIIGVWLEAASIMNLILMCSFFVMVMQAAVRGLDIHCGCFSTEGESNIGLLKMIENTLFVIASVLLVRIIRPLKKKSSKSN